MQCSFVTCHLTSKNILWIYVPGDRYVPTASSGTVADYSKAWLYPHLLTHPISGWLGLLQGSGAAINNSAISRSLYFHLWTRSGYFLSIYSKKCSCPDRAYTCWRLYHIYPQRSPISTAAAVYEEACFPTPRATFGIISPAEQQLKDHACTEGGGYGQENRLHPSKSRLSPGPKSAL